MTFQHFMNDLGWTLLHVTWIACIAVVPIVAVEKLAGSKAARIRNAIAITALGLLICCFPAVFVTVQSANPAAEIPGPTSVTDAVVDASDVMATVSPVSSAAKVQLPFSTAIEMIAKNEADTVLLIEPSVVDGSRNLLEGRRWPSAVPGLYCLGLMLMLAKLSTSVWGSMSVRRRKRPRRGSG